MSGPGAPSAAGSGVGAALDELARRLAAGGVGPPRVAVLVRPDRAAADLPRVREAAPGAELVVLEAAQDDPESAARRCLLASRGPFDAVVDLVGGPGVPGRLRSTFLHTRRGGCYVAVLPPGGRRPATDRARARVRALLEDPPAGLADALARVVVAERFVAADSTARALPTLSEHDADAFLALEPRRGRVLETRPGASWSPLRRVRTASTDTGVAVPAAYDAPALSVRAYDDVVCGPAQVLLSGGVVLAESFTKVSRGPRQQAGGLLDLAPGFVHDPGWGEPTERLGGTFLHLDNVMRGHFGHALSEQVARVWAWDVARRHDPSVRALVFAGPDGLARWEHDLLEAAGIPAGRLVVASRPVRVERLIGCTPQYSRPDHAHPDLLATYDRIGAALERRASPGRSWPRRVFLTRRPGKRACRNADDVVAEHVARGFEVVLPEELPLADQVTLVRRAEVVAGFAGSGTFHIALAGAPRHVVVVGSESYPAHNEVMMSAVVGHRLDLVRCRPDVPREDGVFSREAFHSDYTYDPAREGRLLREVLDGLGPPAR